MQKWEYLVTNYRSERFQNYINEDFINAFGIDGWELVHIQHTSTSTDWYFNYLLTFKRPKHEQVSSNEQRPGDSKEVRRLAEILCELFGKKEDIPKDREAGISQSQQEVRNSITNPKQIGSNDAGFDESGYQSSDSSIESERNE